MVRVINWNYNWNKAHLPETAYKQIDPAESATVY